MTTRRPVQYFVAEEEELEASNIVSCNRCPHTPVAVASDDMRAVPPSEVSRGLARACGGAAAQC